jgi:AraC family transcriptional regulator
MQELSTVFIAPCQLAFVRMTGAYPTASLAAWEKLLTWLSQRGHEIKDGVGYGLSIDDPRTTPEPELRYDACVKVPDTWSASDALIVGVRYFRGGAYFKQRFVGSYAQIGRSVAEARDILVPREGLIHDVWRPVLTMNYSYPSITAPSEQVADVCIPVLPDRRIEPRIIH